MSAFSKKLRAYTAEQIGHPGEHKRQEIAAAFLDDNPDPAGTPSATWRGELEYRPLVAVQADALTVLLADIRTILRLDDGVPSTQAAPHWITAVRAFAEHVRTAPTPSATIVSGPAAIAKLMGGRP